VNCEDTEVLSRYTLGFLVMACFFVTACDRIGTGNDDDAVSPAAAAAESTSTGFTDVEAKVSAFVEGRNLNGAGLAVVDADAGVVYEAYWGEFGPDRISFFASSSKQLVAGIMFALQEDGLLDLNAPLSDIVGDDWGDLGEQGQMSVAQMISNSSGLVGLSPNPAYPPYLCQLSIDNELEACGATIASTSDDEARVVPPDTQFRYGGGQWQVAGAVAEYVSGQSWDELLDSVYREPCGLTESFGFNNHWATLGAESLVYPVNFDGDLNLLAPTENPHIEAGGYSTVPDYIELLLLHLRGGQCPNGSVLTQASLDEFHSDRVGEVWGGNAGSANTGYGYGWWHDRTTGRVSAGGAYGSVPWLDLDNGYGAYLVVEQNSSTGQALKGQIQDLIHEIMTT